MSPLTTGPYRGQGPGLPRPSGSPARPWLWTVLACAALLLLPAVVWLLVPRPAGFVLPPSASAAAAEPAPSEAPAASAPRAARSPRRPRPAASTVEAASDAPVTGLVLDPDGKPMARAFVGCDDRDQMLATATDEEGRFTLAAGAAGCFAIASHADFMPAERVQLAAGRAVTLRLRRGGVIEGVVVDEHDAPVTSYQLAIESYLGTSDNPPTIGLVKAVQDPRGAFRWESLAPGSYVLGASAPGRPPGRSRSVDVEIDRTTHHVRIVIAPGATLSGRIIDADTRKPVAGAVIALDMGSMSGFGAVSPGRSDESGAYALAGVPDGPFSIRITHGRYRSRIVPGITTRGGAGAQQDVELHLFTDGGPTDELAGIGATLAQTPRGVKIVALIPGGPALGAGLQVGDTFARVDGVDVAGLPVGDCIQRLRGAEGSIVNVKVDRGGKTVEVTMTRRIVTY